MRLYDDLRLRLLDLSKRNQLLNYRFSARSKRLLQVIDCSLEEVYARLAGSEANLRVLPLPEPDDIPRDEQTDEFRGALDHARTSDIEYLAGLEALEATGRDDETSIARLEKELRDRVRDQLGLPPRQSRKEINRVEHARSLGIDPSLELNSTQLVSRDRELQTLKFPDELESLMEKISADARLAEQEMGLSTLYLAFGFLEWYESDASDKKAWAPLLLLPVRVEKQKVKGKPIYSISAREGGAEANLSLQKLLERDFNRALPDFDAGDTESIGSVEKYFNQVTIATEDLKRWQLRRWLVLGHFAFGRFAMYADLAPENWDSPAAHVLVGSILSGVERTGDPAALPSVPDDYPIDEPDLEKIAPFLIQDADASQHSALIDVMKGKNLVIQGPPGTGKSQTITNVVANALAAGKRVLFLAEKQAALEVVKRRLDRAELGEFCLELHSDKASPKAVVESVKSRCDLGIGRMLPEGQKTDPILARSRKEITAYLSALHAKDPDGATAFGLIWESLRGKSVHPDAARQFKSVRLLANVLEPSRLAETFGELELFAGMAARFQTSFGHPAHSPWADARFSDFPAYEAPSFLSALQALKSSADITLSALSRDSDLGVHRVDDYAAIIELDAALGDAPDADLIVRIECLDLDDLEKALSIRSELLTNDVHLAATPELRFEVPAVLEIAVAHAHSRASAEFLDQFPAEAYARGDAEIVELEGLADAVEAVLPALGALGLSEDQPARNLAAITTAAIIGGTTDEQHRAWFRSLTDASASELQAAAARWRPLVEAEDAWTSALPGYQVSERPRVEDLERAASVLRESGLGWALARLTGTLRRAHELTGGLGFSDIPSSDDLKALAAHVRMVEAFESDSNVADAFGAAWRGLDTPVSEVLGARQIRDFIRRKVLPLEGGDRIVECLFTVDVGAFSTLEALVPACSRFLGLLAQLKGNLDDRPSGEVAKAARERVEQLRAFLRVDPQRALSGMKSSIRKISEAHASVVRNERLKVALAECANRSEASSLGSNPEQIESTRAAIKWVRTVRATKAKDELKNALLSRRAHEIRSAIREAANGWDAIVEERAVVVARLSEFGAEQFAQMPLNELTAFLEKLLERDQELADYISLRRHRAQLEAAGLSEFLSCADRLGLPPESLQDVFRLIVAEHRAAMLRRAPELAGANGSALETRRRAFAERDRAKMATDRAVIREKLLSAQPPTGSNIGSKKTWTQMRLLHNEFTKSQRFTPVRQLLVRAGAAIQALKPCFMMSPLSLAKFVEAGSLEFDLLVVDEASQMRPEDALGGMLRTTQIVVVGDAKQLPPTDFFNRADGQDGNADDDGADDIDAESILEACEATFGERRRLKWHYRSRCESLIAFSNQAFYDGSLITFPMAKPGSFSIEMVRVDGVYRDRRNPAEAARIAEEAIVFMRNFADAEDHELPTLGIVAVNVEQRELILEELRQLCTGDELVERYREKADRKGEPLFVKNLENVQGDERDHIFISMTYGRKHGEPHLAQNFGPINRKQGHRRLNVLFTRARVRIGLFVSFGSTDVRPTEVSSEGVRALKHYLEYAETGGRAVVRSVGGEPDSDFEIEVANRLRLRRYQVDLQVGVSSFRIDLGVRHPDHPERFLAGIECDGAAYHSSKSARDRDRLREETLTSFGWDIVRVWSTDWFDNPDLETDKLVRRLEELRGRAPRVFYSFPALHLAEGSATIVSQSAACAGEATPAPHPVPTAPPKPATATSIDQEHALGNDDLLDADRHLTGEEAVRVLEAFRDRVIRPANSNWEAHRSILRPAMIETFVQQRIVDPSDWYTKIPQYLRAGTNPAEKNRHLEAICEIVERISLTERK